MKKTILTLGILLAFSISCFGVGPGMGMRSMAMGGAGIALANDVSAVYLNPAGLMYGPENFDLKIHGGGAMTGVTQVSEALASGDKFIEDNFDKDLTASIMGKGGISFSIKRVGISLLQAEVAGEFDKPKNSLDIKTRGNLNASLALTLGSTFSTPIFSEVAFGINIKTISQSLIEMNIADQGLQGTGAQEVSNGSGFGFDVGAQTKLTPLITGGIVIRNLASSINLNGTSTDLTVYPTGTVETSSETKFTETKTLPTEIGIGVAGIIPTTGTIIAGDLELYSVDNESYTDIHIGVEQKVIFNLLALRLGYFTYGPSSDSYITYGIGLNLSGFNAGLAAANSSQDPASNMTFIGMGTSF